jgi:hypothetical protein
MSQTASGSLVNRPVMLWIGWLSGVVGFVLGIVFYYAAKSDRELSYYVCPERAVVSAAANAQRATSARIMLWNAGKTDIYRDDVKEEVEASFGPMISAPILSVKLVSEKGDVRNFDPKLVSGRLRVSWNIMAANSGVLLESTTPATKPSQSFCQLT